MKKKVNDLPIWIKIFILIVTLFFLYSILTKPNVGTPKIPPALRRQLINAQDRWMDGPKQIKQSKSIMFNLFSKGDDKCPIDLEVRLWMENAFLWLVEQFGTENIVSIPMLYPTPEHFQISYDGSKDSLVNTAKIIARQMQIEFDEINLEIFDQSIQEYSGDLGFKIWSEFDKTSKIKPAAGLYFGRNEKGKFDIFIERNCLADPENLVATIAHEFSHVKLLGEKRVEFNDEYLTDLTPVIFGLGIFNANSAYKDWKTFESYGHNSIGYLKQREWGYALALYAYFREEEATDWIKYLTPNIRSDFKKSMKFIKANQDKVFIEEYKGPGD